MKNASSRLARLEQKIDGRGGIMSWDWANDAYYLALPTRRQQQIEVIMEKLRPYLPHDPAAAMETLTHEELDELEKFYIAKFDAEALS